MVQVYLNKRRDVLNTPLWAKYGQYLCLLCIKKKPRQGAFRSNFHRARYAAAISNALILAVKRLLWRAALFL